MVIQTPYSDLHLPEATHFLEIIFNNNDDGNDDDHVKASLVIDGQ